MTYMKTKIKEIVDKIMSDSEKSRREGLLALEGAMEVLADPRDVYYVCLQLVIDGTDAADIEDIATNLIVSDAKTYEEKRLMDMKKVGALGIQRGDNPRILFLKLWSMIPRDELPDEFTLGYDGWLRVTHGGELPE